MLKHYSVNEAKEESTCNRSKENICPWYYKQ